MVCNVSVKCCGVKLKKKAFRLHMATNHVCNRVVSVWTGLPEHVVESILVY